MPKFSILHHNCLLVIFKIRNLLFLSVSMVTLIIIMFVYFRNTVNDQSIISNTICRYKKEKSTLVVSVVKCRDLPAKDPNVGSSDPYVKLQLLPEKQHKVKTRVLRKTRNPVYDEDFTFYGINQNQLQVKLVSSTAKRSFKNLF